MGFSKEYCKKSYVFIDFCIRIKRENEKLNSVEVLYTLKWQIILAEIIGMSDV